MVEHKGGIIFINSICYCQIVWVRSNSNSIKHSCILLSLTLPLFYTYVHTRCLKLNCRETCTHAHTHIRILGILHQISCSDRVIRYLGYEGRGGYCCGSLLLCPFGFVIGTNDDWNGYEILSITTPDVTPINPSLDRSSVTSKTNSGNDGGFLSRLVNTMVEC